MSTEPIHNINDLFNELQKRINKDNNLKSHINLLKQYNGTDWKNYVRFSDHSYHREIIFRNELFDILIISWKQGQQTKIHDHPDHGCLMRVLQGKLCENIYLNKNGLTLIGSNIIDTDNIGHREGSSIIHNIKSLNDTVSLHIYSPGYYVPKLYD